MDRRHALLRQTAAGQDGQFAAAQAVELGFSYRMLQSLRNAGVTAQLRFGVSRFTSAPGDPDEAITAYLACWPYGVICRASAAAHHRLRRVAKPSQPEIVVPHRVSCSPAGITVYRTRNLDKLDIIRVGGVAYTGLARTVLDLSDVRRPWDTLGLLDDAIVGGASRAWIHSRACALSNGRAGVALVRRATAKDAAGVFHSWLERVSAHLYRAAALPDPRWNVPLYDADGRFIGVVDAFWQQWRVVSEKEGMRFHTSPQQRRKDAKRFNRMLEARYSVRRFTWEDVVRTPVDVAATMHCALRAAGCDLDPALIPRHIEVPDRPFL